MIAFNDMLMRLPSRTCFNARRGRWRRYGADLAGEPEIERETELLRQVERQSERLFRDLSFLIRPYVGIVQKDAEILADTVRSLRDRAIMNRYEADFADESDAQWRALLAGRTWEEWETRHKENIIWLGEQTIALRILEGPVRERAQAALQGRRRDITRLREESASCHTSIRHLEKDRRSPVQLGQEIAALQEELAHLEIFQLALKLASDLMEEANHELGQTFGPDLNRRTADNLKRLTAGRYDDVTIDPKFSVRVKTPQASYRDAQLFSEGTTDQIYLAMRIALADLIDKSNDPLPLLLDDVLVNFDATRRRLAIDYLKEHTHRTGRQIILLTCHPELSALAQGVRTVHLDRS